MVLAISKLLRRLTKRKVQQNIAYLYNLECIAQISNCLSWTKCVAVLIAYSRAVILQYISCNKNYTFQENRTCVVESSAVNMGKCSNKPVSPPTKTFNDSGYASPVSQIAQVPAELKSEEESSKCTRSFFFRIRFLALKTKQNFVPL